MKFYTGKKKNKKKNILCIKYLIKFNIISFFDI